MVSLDISPQEAALSILQSGETEALREEVAAPGDGMGRRERALLPGLGDAVSALLPPRVAFLPSSFCSTDEAREVRWFAQAMAR